MGRGRSRGWVVQVPCIFPRLHVVKNSINDNQSLPDPQVKSFLESRVLGQLRTQETVNLNVVVCAPFVTGQSQRKDVGPCNSKVKIKFLKGVYCVNHCLSVPVITNVHHVVRNPPVLFCLAPPGLKSECSVHTKGQVRSAFQN